MCDGTQKFGYGRGLDDSDMSFAANKQINKPTMRPLLLEASQDILRLMHHTYRNQGFQLFVSFFEIYGGKLFDLLNDRR